MSEEGVLFSVGLVMGIIIGAWLAFAGNTASWERDAIKRGYAEYSATTGEWRWKEAVE